MKLSFRILSETVFAHCFGIEVSIKTCLVYFLTLRMKKFRCKKMNNYFLLVTFHSVSTGKMYSTGLFATGPTFLVTSSFGWVCNFLWAKVLGPLVTMVRYQKCSKPKYLLCNVWRTYPLWWSKSYKWGKLMNSKVIH